MLEKEKLWGLDHLWSVFHWLDNQDLDYHFLEEDARLQKINLTLQLSNLLIFKILVKFTTNNLTFPNNNSSFNENINN